MKKKICYEKWIDPLNTNIAETEWPGFDQDEDGNEVQVHAAKITQVMHTPFGALTMLSNTMATNYFDFWWIHTNFDITNGIKDVIKGVPGVETLEIYTRYRARVGFPKSGFFESGRVMGAIQAAVTEIDREQQNQLLIGLPLNIAQHVIDMRNKVDDRYENWAMLVLPNGQIEVITSDNIDKLYQEKLTTFKSTTHLVGGRLLTSEA
jgi:hypothetical protein